MRKVFTTGVCTLMWAASAMSAHAQTAVKIAYINSTQLFQAAPGRAEAAATLDKERSAAQDKYKAMQDSMTKLTDAYEKDLPTLTEALKATRVKALREKQTAFTERADKMTADLNEREADLLQPIQEMLQKVIEDYRAEMGLTMIFDVASGQGIAAIDKNLDKTDVLLARLIKMPAPKAAATTKAPAGPTAAPAGVGKKPPTNPPTR